MKTKEEILETIVKVVREIINQPWIEEVEITGETRFLQDMEIESIEFVQMGEKLQAAFGESLDFSQWLSDKAFEEILELSVQDLIDYIYLCQ